MRLGLCCLFIEAPIRFRTTTATHLLKMERGDALRKLSGLCLSNAKALAAAIRFCAAGGIGDFRINSRILPVRTHPEAGYAIHDLPESEAIVQAFRNCGTLARKLDVRLTFHPDQFVLLNSPNPAVVERSIADLIYQAEVSEWVGADVINIHGGGGYGDKPGALKRLARNLNRLPDMVRTRLTIENDDRTYTPADLIPICRAERIPLVYDVHHHRCLPDGLSVEAVTEAALATWDREPLFHVSSPIEGWDGPNPRRHHDYVDVRDVPDAWKTLDPLTVEVEAKAKEQAVIRLRKDLEERLQR